ncbi:MAG: hypothetical protein KatS3mg070_0972 [Meiothermus sp.]|uniref:hypothetical protein n=1 Tax=Meiothermus sp. TaxID=1955249 RepID=UPI0021DD621A|nr:hypothetical protein [Meiothermus sp.]GIW27609.1 MAG: hypothetical protein KatS3mg070_0972 [Meiothermus sp.]
MTSSWKYLAGFVLMSTLALAQVAPDAAQVLEKMRQAHGGQALANLRTYREVATLTTFSGPQAEHRLTVVSYVDFLSQRLRVEYRDGANLIQVLQVSPAGGQSWSAISGRKALESTLTKELRNGLYQTWYGLRLGGNGREMARLEGRRTFGDVTGQAVVVRTQGSQTTYLFNAQHQLVAERYQNSQGQLTVLYSDLRLVSGIRIPFRARLYADGDLFAEVAVQEARVNPTLGPETFKLP